MKFTSKRKQLAKLAAIVMAFNIVLAGVGVVIPYPTAQHREVARHLANNPTQTDLAHLTSSPEGNWTMYAGLMMTVVQLIVYIVAIYFAYRYVRQQRLTANASGVTTGIFAVASVASSTASVGLTNLYGIEPIAYENVGAFIALAVLNLVFSFLLTFIIVLIVEKVYDRKHSFAVE